MNINIKHEIRNIRNMLHCIEPINDDDDMTTLILGQKLLFKKPDHTECHNAGCFRCDPAVFLFGNLIPSYNTFCEEGRLT